MVARGDKGLERVTGSYRRLKRVNGSCKVLQGVKGG